jgi:hypothetical protein
VMTAENAFREWQKGHLSRSTAEREELEMLRRWRNGLAARVPPAAKTYRGP